MLVSFASLVENAGDAQVEAFNLTNCLQAIEMTGGLSTWRVTARDNFAGSHAQIFS
jgi:hypothetical protein